MNKFVDEVVSHYQKLANEIYEEYKFVLENTQQKKASLERLAIKYGIGSQFTLPTQFTLELQEQLRDDGLLEKTDSILGQ